MTHIPHNSFNPLDLFRKTPAQKIQTIQKKLVKESKELQFKLKLIELKHHMNCELLLYLNSLE